jgi:hypothetical protein
MSTQYLKQFVPKVSVLCKQLGDLWQLKYATMPNGACFDTSEDFQLLTMVRVVKYLPPRTDFIPGYDIVVYLWRRVRGSRGCSQEDEHVR